MHRTIRRLHLLASVLVLPAVVIPTTAWLAAAPAPVIRARTLRVEPVSVLLRGPEAEQALLVTAVDASGLEHDDTRAAKYSSSNPSVARVSREGLVRIAGNGSAEIRVEAAGQIASVRVAARDAAVPQRLNFTNHILPVLSKAGCNQGICHGKAGGQHGFKLSVFAFDPRADYDAIVKEARGRRVRSCDPERSLLLLKPTGRLPHGGGRRLVVGSPEYRLLLRWITEGMPFAGARDPVLQRVEISPA